MKSSISQAKWLDIGYTLFSIEGLYGIQVERLARIAQLNKSGFYHYFGDRDSFVEHLLKLHRQKAVALASAIREAPNFDPDYINLIVEWKEAVFFHRQLIVHRQIQVLEKCFEEVNCITDPHIVSLWAEYLGIAAHDQLAFRYYVMVRDMFYTRLKPENISYDFIRTLADDARKMVNEMIATTTGEIDGCV